MTEKSEDPLTYLSAQNSIQRYFIGELLRRLALDVPGLDLGKLLERLHYFSEEAPNTPEEGSPEIQAAAREEIGALIRMVEEVVEEVREK